MIFTIVDCLNNMDGLTIDEIDDLLPKKEKFWIRPLVMQHHGSNSKHDLKWYWYWNICFSEINIFTLIYFIKKYCHQALSIYLPESKIKEIRKDKIKKLN